MDLETYIARAAEVGIDRRYLADRFPEDFITTVCTYSEGQYARRVGDRAGTPHALEDLSHLNPPRGHGNTAGIIKWWRSKSKEERRALMLERMAAAKRRL